MKPLIVGLLVLGTVCGNQLLAHTGLPCPEAKEASEEILRNTADVKPFSSQGTYQAVYDIIVELPFYRDAMALHIKWMSHLTQGRPVIIEAGGGTGIMNAASRLALPNAKNIMVDLNPAVADQAASKGVPRDRIVITSITDLEMNRTEAKTKGLGDVFSETGKDSEHVRIAANSVDHIFSHSVIWGLPDPGQFFKESARVLKPGATLGVSTVGENIANYKNNFIDYMSKHLMVAVKAGRVTQEQHDTFIGQNQQIVQVVKSPMSVQKLKAYGEAHGLELVDVQDCYVVSTPDGPRPFFHQVLFRKR